MLSLLWNELLYRPLYNALIFLIEVLPYKDLGFAIIILTILIRGILYIPSKKGLKSQTALQEVQPKIQKLKETYKNDPQKQAQETMRLYKEHGVNPFSSCLPLLIQLPVLIALFYVFQKGLSPENVQYLYLPLKGFNFTDINIMFLGVLDLVNKNIGSRYIMPLIVGMLQFYQMQMLVKSQAKPTSTKTEAMPFDPQATNKMMSYFLPVMVAFFSASYPAGLSLYWATSTSFSIFQQMKVLKTKEEHIKKIDAEKNNIVMTEIEDVKEVQKLLGKKKRKNN